jgi:non-heme chloroperoxidase
MWRTSDPDRPSIAVDEWGPPDPRATVVLLHGGGQTRHAWRGLGESLGADGVRALAVDLRGHGDSGWAPDGDYGYDAFIGDVQAVTHAAGAAAPIYVGASLGGAIALAGVGEHRLPARGLVLVDTAPHLEASGVAGLREFMTGRPDGYASLDEVADAIAAFTGRARPESTAGLHKNLRVDDAGRYHWHWDPTFMGAGDARDPDARSRRLAAAAMSLDVPTLLIRGGQSDLLSEDGAQAFLDLCPHADYVNIADAAHMIAADRNDQFTAAVRSFCLGLAGRDLTR